MRVGLSMRGSRLGSELRDSLARDWWTLADRLGGGHHWLPLPNLGVGVVEMAEDLGLQGLILTGGDDLGAYPERDATEQALLGWAEQRRLPVLGVCRGMQVLCRYFGGQIVECSNHDHRATRHSMFWPATGQNWTVNSYHNFQVLAGPPELEVIGLGPEDSVEAVRHRSLPWLGIQWHPERDNPEQWRHDQLIQDFLGQCLESNLQAQAVYWFTGLAGSGKTTLATEFSRRLRQVGRRPVFLDGDRLRQSIAQDLGYTRSDRLQAAMRYARLCALLAEQGQPVVCATISMFHEVRAWNRIHIPGYREIYVRVRPEVLAARDQKGLYSQASPNVAGVDLEVELPETPDDIIDNNGELSPEQLMEQLLPQITGNGRRL